LIYDDNGFVTTISFYCTNGNRQEIRGKSTFLFDAQGNMLAKSSPDGRPEGDALTDAGANDPSLCPLP
jgi:hypothetical protein